MSYIYFGRKMKKIIFLLVFSLLNSFNLYSAEEVEEVVIIGSQIKAID
jgi:hypothetical protein